MSKHEQPEPFAWSRVRSGDWDDILISGVVIDGFGRYVYIPVSRLAEFEAFVKQIREEVEGG